MVMGLVNLVRKSGVSALALASTDDIPCPCTLVLLYSQNGPQFTVLLTASIPIHGIRHKQSFVLRFDGDNLVPGKISLENTGIPVSTESLKSITRQGQPELRTLSLTLKAPCSVWYPRTLASEASTFNTSSQELVTLARTTKIRILFDTNWLGRYLPTLQSISQRSSQLIGVPVSRHNVFSKSYLQADHSLLKFVKDANPAGLSLLEGAAPDVVPSVEDAEPGVPVFDYAADDPPPSYAPRMKRSIDTTSSARGSTPDLPLSKRLLQDPPSVRSISVSSDATVPVDLFQDAINSAVAKVLPDMLQDRIPLIVQSVLSKVFDGHSPSPSLSPISPSRHIATAPIQPRPSPSHKPTPTTPVNSIVKDMMKPYLQKFNADMMDEVLEQVSDLYGSASVDFQEELDDHRLAIGIIKEDHVADFERECAEMLTEHKERMAGMIEMAEEEVEEYVGKVASQLCANCKYKCLHSAKDKQSGLEQGQRANSSPLG
ncbi:hypothetical protein NX059_012318 [Plenodomus lindquistii]|nr:hypothetical protein NX059_012318 [Plenodomus lindquistii]